MFRVNPQGMLAHANGQTRYDACTKFETDQQELGPKEIHKIGLENVEELKEVGYIYCCIYVDN